MAIPATQLRVGQVINFEDQLWVCVKLEQKKLSKGGGAVQAKLKNLTRGDHITHRFRSADKVETAYLDKKDCEYLYPEGESFVFMDTEDYEQYQLHNDFVGDLMPFVKHNERVVVTFYEEKPISVDLPPAVVLRISETEPGFKGDSVNNVFKPATLETGLQVKIPNHVTEGELVKISTETGEFIERVKDK
ncbi:MAG: elongation factor P [Planctomycetota bacterium]|nr:elongation factor P [Planctomycetota bacterium]